MANYKSWKDVARQQGIQLKEDKILDYKLPSTVYENKYNQKKKVNNFGQESPKQEVPLLKRYEETVPTWQQVARQQGMDVQDPEPKTKETYDYWKNDPIKSAAKNVYAGFGMLGRGAIGAIDMTLGDKNIPFIDNMLEKGKADIKREDFQLNKINSSNPIGNVAGRVTQGFGQAIPTLALAMLNPAAAAVTTLTAGGTRIAASMAVNPTTLTAAKTVLSQMVKNPTLYSSMVTTVGNQYLQGVNQGAKREDAIRSAILGGVPSAIIEVSGGLENITGILANKTKGIAGKALQSALEEGFEEILQYPVENLGQKMAYDKNMPWLSVKKQAVVNPVEMLQNGLVGATVGGLMGGGASVINQSQQKKFSKQLNAEYEDVLKNLPEDSPIMARVKELKDNSAKIDEKAKVWVINSARQQGYSFESETDKLLQKTQSIIQPQLNENIVGEQIVNNNETFVKTQNSGSTISNPILRVFNIQNIKNPQEVKQNIYNTYKDSIISDSNVSKPIMNKYANMPIEVSRATINQTFQADDKFSQNTDNEIKIAAMAKLPEIIQNGQVEIVNQSDKSSSKTTYAKITSKVAVNGLDYNVTLDIRKTDNGNKLFVHSIQTVDPRVRQALNNISNAIGIKINIVPNIASPDGSDLDFANGQYDWHSKTLEVSLLANNPLLVVAKHEITHMLQQQNPKQYTEYKDYVVSALKANNTYQDIYDSMTKLYEDRGLKYNPTYIEDEIVADATELFLTDEAAIKNLVAENKSLGQKILDILREFIEKVSEAVGKTSNWFALDQLRQAEKLWVNALNDVVESKQSDNIEAEAATTQMSVKDGIDNKYLYHGTSEGAFRQIRKKGLNPPGNTSDSKYVFFSNNEKYSKTYADRKGGPRGGRILRVKKTDDIILDADRKSTKTNTDYRTLNNIEPKDIEVKVGNDWVNIQDYYDEDFGIEKITKKYSLKDSQNRELSKEQQEYFKDSKVRDEKGNLLVLYHGTDAYKEFNVFKPGKNGWLGGGIYLSSDENYAKRYANKNGYEGRIYKTYVDSKNPLIIKESNPVKEILKAIYGSERIYNNRSAKQSMDTLLITSADIKKLKNKGYDGILWEFGGTHEISVFNSEQIKNVDNKKPTADADIRFSLKEMDKKYLEAVEKGDMETAQRMVNEYAAEKGYAENDDYRMMHQAPTNNGDNAPLHDITKIYPKDIYSSDGIRYYGDGESYDYESIRKIEKAKDRPDLRVRVYRAVPKDIKDERFRVGDWVTLSESYATLHGKRNINGPYKIIAYVTEAKNLWSDGNSINEFGFDDGKTYAYQNTKNNLKLLDAVTHDEEGNVIPLSKRFNKKEYSTRYSVKEPIDTDNLKDVLLSKHSEYNTNKEALELAEGAIKDLSKIKYSLSSTRRKVDRDRSGAGIKTIADGITREFINKGYVELKGRKISNPEELAEIAQVFRDPRFETFRIFYVKNNKIVAHEGISSRLPGLSGAFLNVPKESDYSDDFDFMLAQEKWRRTRFDDMRDRAKRLKADGYYLLHNHPSGNPDASSADLTLTKLFSKEIKGFKGHVIINSNKFSVIGKDGMNIMQDMQQQQIEMFLKPSVQNKLLGTSITGTKSIAEIAKSLQLSKDRSVVIYADVKGKIRGIQEIPNGMIRDRVSIKGYLKNQGIHFGSGWMFIATKSQDILPITKKLIEQKYLVDAVYTDGSDFTIAMRDSGADPSSEFAWAGIKEYDISAERVNESTRFQIKDSRDSKTVERLKKTNENLREQFKLTKGINLDKNSIKKLSRKVLKDYSSTYDKAQLETRMLELYSRFANNQIEYDDMTAEIKSISRDIIENASVLNDNMHKQYADLRRTLRDTAITLPDRYKDDLKAVGGFDSFRKKNLSRIKLVNDGMSVDQLYQELSDLYPEFFNKDVANQADQLMLIGDVLDGLTPIYENPFNVDFNEVIDYLSMELFSDSTDIPEAKPTFADKQKAKLDETKVQNKARIKDLKLQNKDNIDWIKYQNKEKIQSVLSKEKIKRDKAVEKVKTQYKGDAYVTWWKTKLKENDIRSHYQEMIKELRNDKNEKMEQQASRYKERISNIYESRKMREAKASIGRKVKRLDSMLRKPEKKKHINKALEKSIAELLTQINFETDKQKEATILKLRDLRAEYEKIAKVSDEDGIETTADPYIMDALELLHGKRLIDMNLEELEILNNIVGYFEHMVKGYNQAFLSGKWVDISVKSEGILKDLETDKPQNVSAYDPVNWFKNMMNWGMLTPQMFFERMGSTFYSLYGDFRNALDVKINNTEIAQEYMSNLLKNSKDDIKEWTGSKAKAKAFKLQGNKTIELTPSQVMSLYLLFKREQARGHILGLGIKPSPITEVDSKGIKHIKRQFEPSIVTPVDIAKILGVLTKEQKNIADGIGKFMNTTSKQWVNEATLANYGYELAKEENYFPIKTDRDFLKSDFDNTNLDPTFTSMGFLKSTVKGAGNAIIIEDIFDVFTEHADKAATYNAFVTVTESTKKIINYKTKEDSIKQSMSKKYGRDAFDYLHKFMVDLQGGARVEGGPPMVNALIRNTKRTVLGLNMRTVIQQPTAIIRASALIDPKYIIKGIAQKSEYDEMLEHSPIALWKSWGYFNLDTGRTMKDIILNQVPLLDKQYIPIQIADNITWTKLWNAVKLEITDQYPRLSGKEYFEAVSNRFSEIVDRTQVVDTVMHRSDIMRQKDSGWKLLTAFMAEPTKNYNLLLNASEKYNNDKTEENKKALLRTTSAWMATTLINTFVISMVDIWRRKDNDDETLLNKWMDNILNEVTGMVPMVRDFYSILQGYSIKRMEYNGFEKIGRSITRTASYVEEMSNGEKHKYPLRLITKDWIEAISYVFGVGTINVNREIEAILRNYVKVTGNEKGIASDIYEFMFKK